MAFYFLMKLVAEMAEGAHCAIIVPMEVLDARYGIAAKRVLCQHTALSAIIHFSQKMTRLQSMLVGLHRQLGGLTKRGFAIIL